MIDLENFYIDYIIKRYYIFWKKPNLIVFLMGMFSKFLIDYEDESTVMMMKYNCRCIALWNIDKILIILVTEMVDLYATTVL